MAPSSAHPIGAVPPSTNRRRTPDPAPPSEGADGELSALLALVDRRRLARAGDALRWRLGTGSPAPDDATGETDGAAPAPAPTAEPTTGADDRSTLTGPPGRLIELERVGTSVGILRIGKPVGLSFTAGQYVRLGLTGVRRAKLTIASAPHDPYLEVCVEGIPGGRLTPRLLALGPGAVLDVDDRAKGSFVLDRSGAVHLMVATGTGIAPFRSMIRDALHRGLADSFLVLHGASYAEHLPYRDELAALAASDAARAVHPDGQPTRRSTQPELDGRDRPGRRSRREDVADRRRTLDPRLRLRERRHGGHGHRRSGGRRPEGAFGDVRLSRLGEHRVIEGEKWSLNTARSVGSAAPPAR